MLSIGIWFVFLNVSLSCDLKVNFYLCSRDRTLDKKHLYIEMEKSLRRSDNLKFEISRLSRLEHFVDYVSFSDKLTQIVLESIFEFARLLSNYLRFIAQFGIFS
jgi:hypothetical protein